VKKLIKFFLIIILAFSISYLLLKHLKKENENNENNQVSETEIKSYNSNIILNVRYISKDNKGNLYTIKAKKGEIDIKNTNIIFLSDVKASIELIDSDKIEIKADFGKYNILNYDTIFSKNVIVNYLDNEINGEYLDLSIINNLITISRNIILKNLENIVLADNIEINIKTKDAIINMYETNKKVQIKNKN